MNKEYTYDIGKYTIGVDENSEDRIGLTVAMIENNEIKFLGNCYGDNARCIDLLIRENQELKELNIAISKGLKKVTVKRNKWRNRYYKVRRENDDQQKEFMEYLEGEINNIKSTYSQVNGNYFRMNDVIETHRKDLSKYKEIIGGKK